MLEAFAQVGGFTEWKRSNVRMRPRCSLSQHAIAASRLWRNVKHENVYLKGYANMGEFTVGLAAYMTFFNAERPHQALGYATPDEVYRTGIGGGAIILDKYGSGIAKKLEMKETGQRRAAVCEEKITA